MQAKDIRDIEVGYEVPSLSKIVTTDVSKAYSGWPEVRNIHTDEEIARNLGLPTVLMQGMLGAAYISQLCINLLGEHWIKGGKLSVKFVKPVFPPQRLAVKAIVSNKLKENNAVRILLDVWLEDGQGQKVQVGTATCLVS